jgi:hypothetical protein
VGLARARSLPPWLALSLPCGARKYYKAPRNDPFPIRIGRVSVRERISKLRKLAGSEFCKVPILEAWSEVAGTRCSLVV